MREREIVTFDAAIVIWPVMSLASMTVLAVVMVVPDIGVSARRAGVPACGGVLPVGGVDVVGGGVELVVGAGVELVVGGGVELVVGAGVELVVGAGVELVVGAGVEVVGV